MLDTYHPSDRVALVLGEEVEGISTELRSKCDTLLEIPMHGQKESFNVSVAAGIALYQLTL
jgi:tRNA G18 (ribose-2'-O)-methylase SpoU